MLDDQWPQALKISANRVHVNNTIARSYYSYLRVFSVHSSSPFPLQISKFVLMHKNYIDAINRFP